MISLQRLHTLARIVCAFALFAVVFSSCASEEQKREKRKAKKQEKMRDKNGTGLIIPPSPLER